MKDSSKIQIDFDLLSIISGKPEPFAKGEKLFWNDEHISKQMLEAHLDQERDAASRRHATIKKTCDWIASKLQLPENAEVVDLGCGPGLYCSLLGEMGYKVTGIDYSKRSLEYARQSASEKGLVIDYIYEDYLNMDYIDKFDLALMIYYDFGVFSNDERDMLLRKIWSALKHNGIFVFDLMTPKGNQEEKSGWSVFEEGGFWSSKPYIELFRSFYYEEEKALLRQHAIIEENGKTRVFRLWDRYYSVEDITSVLNRAGFEVIDTYNDLAGSRYQETSEAIGIVTRKRMKL